MKTYLVGGAVRDRLLELEVTERDYVVVGATPADMEALGYRLVGRDFPVFLHPETGDEYALARTERKRGHGHRGFEVHSDTDVTLEEDLRRRDLTVNAMAQADDGSIIDPYNGQRDLQQRRLRHVSDAFSEDPLRVLRVARFAARFAHLGFHVAADTMDLMRDIARSGELLTLSAERLWSETERALASDSPWIYIEVLSDCDAHRALLPELEAATAVAHLKAAAAESAQVDVRFIALLSGLTTDQVGSLCSRLNAPKHHRELARLWVLHEDALNHASVLSPADTLTVLEAADAMRRPERFETLLALVPATRAAFWRAALARCSAVDAAAIAAEGHPGHEIAVRLRDLRVTALKQMD